MDVEHFMKAYYVSDGCVDSVISACDAARRAGCASSACEPAQVRQLLGMLPPSMASAVYGDWRRAGNSGASLLDAKIVRGIINRGDIAKTDGRRLLSLARNADKLAATAQTKGSAATAAAAASAEGGSRRAVRAAAVKTRADAHARAEEEAAEARLAVLGALSRCFGCLATALDALPFDLPPGATWLSTFPILPLPPSAAASPMFQVDSPPASRKRAASSDPDDNGTDGDLQAGPSTTTVPRPTKKARRSGPSPSPTPSASPPAPSPSTPEGVCGGDADMSDADASPPPPSEAEAEVAATLLVLSWGPITRISRAVARKTRPRQQQ
ncbi:hypothetical protein Rsub_06561 [Raphidocelis subcapitata]|uniref:Uncharacterized protein n=1 Tax=Raphidocelis subcapitata TaxID=307507 RepID=A0A2V0P0N3_9CHLO|nr:hypothetical protein Rsub_06561 [Raphidocelis subcapitata]|eukprot:GBF93428.1 hypothetical protein Rsub_06561 [Raphidocelis subcapitata]